MGLESLEEAGANLPGKVAELRAEIEGLFGRVVDAVGSPRGGEERTQQLERELNACVARVYQRCDALQQALLEIKQEGSS